MNINTIRAALAAKSATINNIHEPSINMTNGSSALAPASAEEVISSPQTTTVPEEVKPVRKRRSKAVVNETVTAVPSPSSLDIDTVIAQQLVKGRDYDIIQGCRKPSLLKAGAEKLALIYGFRTSTEIIHRIEQLDKSFVSYEVEVTVYDKTGNIQAQGIGSCNSRERRYLKGDFCCQLNTVLKMAKKRAYVDAVITATGASGTFTQDIEDIIGY